MTDNPPARTKLIRLGTDIGCGRPLSPDADLQLGPDVPVFAIDGDAARLIGIACMAKVQDGYLAAHIVLDGDHEGNAYDYTPEFANMRFDETGAVDGASLMQVHARPRAAKRFQDLMDPVIAAKERAHEQFQGAAAGLILATAARKN